MTRDRITRSDVVIVGAGSAGSVLAERLSADSSCHVTVLEAGPGSDVPAVRELVTDALHLPIGADSPVVRHYTSNLTVHRVADIVRGECLGGSGAVNGCYFRRALAEDFRDMPGWSWPEVQDHYRAVEDLIPTTEHELGHITGSFVAAAHAAGHGSGITAVPLNIDAGRRMGPGAVLLEPAMSRDNLAVLTGLRVNRLLWSGNRVIGVRAVGPDGPTDHLSDRVVLSAGAIGTAQLLMLSGIGPAAHLQEIGIPVAADLPVGQRCWDHPEWTMATSWSPEQSRPVLEAVLDLGKLEIRPYTTGFGAPTTGIGVALMLPDSRGRVSLLSADGADAPRIEHRYDSAAADAVVLAQGCDQVRDMLAGRTDLGEASWSTSQHLAGTAPMGDDEDAVVDRRCRVHGVEGLWVIDGSVLPAPLSRGPHATIAMIGHRGAGLL